MAAMSGDAAMVDAYKHGRDIHTETAMAIHHLADAGKVTKSIRSSAKAVNFGVIYGLTAYGLARDLSKKYNRLVENAEAQQYIDGLFAAFPGIQDWQIAVKDFCIKHGYVYTMFGRRRALRNVQLKGNTYESRMLREEALRQAINTPIQGTASDFTLVSIIKMQEQLHKLPQLAKRIRLVSTVHDSIIAEVDPSAVDISINFMRHIMTKEPLRWIGHKWNSDVPIAVDFKVGQDWHTAKELGDKTYAEHLKSIAVTENDDDW